jgi:hypothetical protein
VSHGQIPPRRNFRTAAKLAREVCHV